MTRILPEERSSHRKSFMERRISAFTASGRLRKVLPIRRILFLKR